MSIFACVIIAALLALAVGEYLMISHMSQQLDELSDKYLDAVAELDPVDAMTPELEIPAWWENEH